MEIVIEFVLLNMVTICAFETLSNMIIVIDFLLSNTEVWARNEHCEINPGYMLRSCKRACGVCADTREDTNTGTIGTWGDVCYNLKLDFCVVWCRLLFALISYLFANVLSVNLRLMITPLLSSNVS
jgi:hypothetical protein